MDDPGLDSGAPDRFTGPMTPEPDLGDQPVTPDSTEPDRLRGPIQVDDVVRSKSSGRLYRVNGATIPANASRRSHSVYDVTDIETGMANGLDGSEIEKVPAHEADRPPVTDNGGAWTVVTRPNRFGPFQKTGFGGSWQEASDHARLYPEEHTPWVVGRDDTHVATHISPKGKETHVTIAPTKEERAAARAEEQRIQAIATEMLTRDPVGNDWLRRTVVNDAGAVLGQYDLTPEEAAKALARAGWDRSAIMRRHS